MKLLKRDSRSSSLWHNSNYLLWQGGQIISFLGNQQQFLALPLLVLAATGSAIQAGIAVSLNTIAVLGMSPLAGILVDRWNRKTILLACESGRMFLTFSIPLAFWLHVLSLWQIYIVALLTGALGTLFQVANTATLPALVEHDQLPAALAQTQAAYSCVRTGGSLLGGALYTLGAALPFLANALSFAASVLTLGLLRGNFQSKQEETELPLLSSIAQGLLWLWKYPLLRFLILINGADSLRYGAGYLVILILARELHVSPTGIGAIFTGAAAGALLGNLVSSLVRRYMSFGKITISMLWLEALMFPLYAIAPSALIMGLIAAAEEFVNPIYTVSLESYRLLATPDALRGRTSSTVQFIVQGAQSIGTLLGGLLIQEIGAKGSALLLGAWLLLLAVLTTLNKRVRHASHLSLDGQST